MDINLRFETRKYKRLSSFEKDSIIQEASKGLTHKKIAEMFGVGRSTVTKLLLNANQTIKNTDKTTARETNKVEEKIDRLQFELYRWLISKYTLSTDRLNNSYFGPDILYNKFHDKDELISMDEILKKSHEIAKKIDLVSFDLNYEWIKSFLKRHNYKRSMFDGNFFINEDQSYSQISPIILDSNPILNFNHTIKSNVPDNFTLAYHTTFDINNIRNHSHNNFNIPITSSEPIFKGLSQSSLPFTFPLNSYYLNNSYFNGYYTNAILSSEARIYNNDTS